MPLNKLFLRPRNWSQLKPHYRATITAVSASSKASRKAWWTFRIFFIFFFCSGGGAEGSPRRQEGRDRFLLKSQRGGFPGGGGAEGPGGCAENWRIWLGAKFFFFGARNV